MRPPEPPQLHPPGRKRLTLVRVALALVVAAVMLDRGAIWLRHQALGRFARAQAERATARVPLHPDDEGPEPRPEAAPSDPTPASEHGPAVPPSTPPTAPSTPVPVQNAIAKLKSASPGPAAGDDLFAQAQIPSLRIEIPPDGTSRLQRRPRDYVRATITEGPHTYTDVAIRLKGGLGSFRQLNDQPSFTLNFDKFVEGQTFHGLKKLHLNRSVQDPSFLSEKICRELFDAAGVPTPQAGHAIVTVNGRAMGLYVLVEGINKQFLKRYFKDAKGNVYDGHSGTDVRDTLPTNAGEDPKDHRGLRALAAATRISDPQKRWVELQKTLDVDRFLSFVALETLLWHWDGYTLARNNYRIFHDRESNRMVFIPQGLDQILTEAQGPIFPDAKGLVAKAVLEIPAAREQYRARFAELYTNVFRTEAIAGRIREVTQHIQAASSRSNPAAAAEQAQRAKNLTRRFQRRSDFLKRQLFPVAPLALAQAKPLPLPSWQPQTDLGEAQLAQETAADGTPVLRISTTSGCTASWRTTVTLNRGKYRLEGRLQTRGVVLPADDPRAGAGFRVSRHRVGQKHTGDRPWTPVTFEFEVQQDASDVELVCELRATQGEIGFDLGSLRLVRR